jgi:[protein-PII] uridylyltransferase
MMLRRITSDSASVSVKNAATGSEILRRSFLDIFRQRRNLTHTISRWHDSQLSGVGPAGIYSLYYQVQENAYHIFTVDEHALRATEEMERLIEGRYTKEFPVFHGAAKSIVQKDLMLLTAFLHDIGKG